MNLTIPDDLKIKFRHLVTARSGLYFKDCDLKDLEKAILDRISERKIDSPLTYYYFLTGAEAKEDEFRELLNRLMVNHTYFFRNQPQFKLLKEKILPEVIARKKEEMIKNHGKIEGKPSLRIWSAGCSTGEEPYSIAIVVKEAIPDLENWDIYATTLDVLLENIDIKNNQQIVDNLAKLCGYYVSFWRGAGPGQSMCWFSFLSRFPR